MSISRHIEVEPLREADIEEAHRICRLAFGTFLGLHNPLDFMDDRNFIAPRWRAGHVEAIAAREGDRLIGSNLATRWGSFGFFGPLTILPEYWGQGVAQRLLQATLAIFERWGVRHTGLFTFAHSAKHVGLYQKFGYWPQYLTALMSRILEDNSQTQAKSGDAMRFLSELPTKEREQAIMACSRLTHDIEKGLDLSGEIQAVCSHGGGDVVFTYTEGALDAFAVCLNGSGTEGGEKTCYVKFGAARGGAGAAERFDQLLDACEAFARSRQANVEAGVNLARRNAYERMRARGYRVMTQGVAMQRPPVDGFNREDVYVMDDWR